MNSIKLKKIIISLFVAAVFTPSLFLFEGKHMSFVSAMEDNRYNANQVSKKQNNRNTSGKLENFYKNLKNVKNSEESNAEKDNGIVKERELVETKRCYLNFFNEVISDNVRVFNGLSLVKKIKIVCILDSFFNALILPNKHNSNNCCQFYGFQGINMESFNKILPAALLFNNLCEDDGSDGLCGISKIESALRDNEERGVLDCDRGGNPLFEKVKSSYFVSFHHNKGEIANYGISEILLNFGDKCFPWEYFVTTSSILLTNKKFIEILHNNLHIDFETLELLIDFEKLAEVDVSKMFGIFSDKGRKYSFNLKEEYSNSFSNIQLFTKGNCNNNDFSSFQKMNLAMVYLNFIRNYMKSLKCFYECAVGTKKIDRTSIVIENTIRNLGRCLFALESDFDQVLKLLNSKSGDNIWNTPTMHINSCSSETLPRGFLYEFLTRGISEVFKTFNKKVDFGELEIDAEEEIFKFVSSVYSKTYEKLKLGGNVDNYNGGYNNDYMNELSSGVDCSDYNENGIKDSDEDLEQYIRLRINRSDKLSDESCAEFIEKILNSG